MRRLPVAFVLVLLLAHSSLAGPTNCPQHYLAGEAPEVGNPHFTDKLKELCYSEFSVWHSGITRTALASVEYLSDKSAAPKRKDYFHADPNLPASDRAELSDYKGSGYDRGHMAPSADMSTEQAQFECFTLANMIPQDPDSNQKIWRLIEKSVRESIKDTGPLYLVTGPLFLEGTAKSINNRVLVPSHTYKAIYNPQTNQAAAYVVRNAPGYAYAVIPIAELERLAGILIFPKLEEEIKGHAMPLPKPSIGKGKVAQEDLSIIPAPQ